MVALRPKLQSGPGVVLNIFVRLVPSSLAFLCFSSVSVSWVGLQLASLLGLEGKEQSKYYSVAAYGKRRASALLYKSFLNQGFGQAGSDFHRPDPKLCTDPVSPTSCVGAAALLTGARPPKRWGLCPTALEPLSAARPEDPIGCLLFAFGLRLPLLFLSSALPRVRGNLGQKPPCTAGRSRVLLSRCPAPPPQQGSVKPSSNFLTLYSSPFTSALLTSFSAVPFHLCPISLYSFDPSHPPVHIGGISQCFH
ncbi:uncharacterized protein LOC109117433 [Fukomys damarensis]|uniref:uncharacterized protein LOC109117433 n=1 Tax=Fukomys damarensis TaxID=885580 RepID=UPI0008FEC1AE|nr:uncharacterized protein LOC109117433 [Fukomys damarensis]